MQLARTQPRILQLRTLQAVLDLEIRGQAHALARVVSVVRRGELGLSKPSRPRGSLLLLGPTGVGKTETVLVTTHHLFGANSLFRFDMSEFQNQDSVHLLLGEHAHQKGFIGAVREKAIEGCLLFDEVEKAHPRVLDLLLQLLDAGRITVATGETLIFNGFYIWMTSNLGAADVMGLQHCTEASAQRHVLTRAEQSLRPELFARIMEKLVYRRLDYDHQRLVAEKFLLRELEFLHNAGHPLEPDSGVLPFLVRKGFHPKLGARPMRDAVEKLVGDAVADTLLEGRAASGKLTVDDSRDILVVR